MPRLMSVSLTEQAVLERRKRVTRRAGWTMLRPGDHLTLCRKVMGRRKGEPLVRIVDVEVVSVRREKLSEITDEDVILEGFGDELFRSYRWARSLSEAFIEFFCDHMGGRPDQEVTRVEWAYLG